MTLKPSQFEKGEIAIRVGVMLCVLLLTSLRLHARGRSRWGWDDGLVCFGCLWMATHIFTSIGFLWRFGKTDSSQLTLFAVSFLCFVLILWSTRLSILASIIRFTPEIGDKKRRRLVFIGFLLLCIIELAQICWACSVNTAWSHFLPQCTNYKRIILFHLISSILSDTFLLIFPLSTLRGLKSTAPRIRTRLSLCFVASACTTVLSIAASLLILIAHNQVSGYLSLLEACTGLIVCNLPVLVVAVRHWLGIRDCPQSEKSFPPIQFAPGPQNSTLHSTLLISRSESEQPSPSTSRLLPNGITSLPTGFHDEEDECDAEMQRICQGNCSKGCIGDGSRDLGDGEARTAKPIQPPRRHSMHI